MGNDRLGGWWLAGASGLLAGLALPPLGLPLLLWLALAGLWALPGSATGARGGALWGGAAVLVSHRWLLGLHPLDWIGVPGPLSLPLAVLLLAICALAAAGLVAVWVALAQRVDPRRLSSALLLSAGWGLAEVLLAKGPLFWLGLGAAALPGDRPLAGLAALGGSGLLATLQLLIGWGLWRCATVPQPRRWIVATAAAVAVSHGLGAAVLAALPLGLPAGQASSGVERVLVLQPAIPTRQKFQWAQQQRLQQRLTAALAEGAQRRVDAVLLPEGALGLEPELAAPVPVELISGGFRWQEVAGAPQQRSALLRMASGEQQASSWLDKHRLVPLGEWVPLAGLGRWSGLSAVGGIEPGAASRLLPRPGGAIAGAICYELSDGSALAAASREGAGWLLASANLDPYPALLQQQFQALAQLRAIETGRWLVSAANTGPSLLVNARGRVVDSLPAGRPATGVFAVPRLQALTPYDRWGEAPLLLLAGAVAWHRRPRR
ncbi:MAG: apolipoprotein N-acyltransferase [Cyanobacteria bacterium M_DeepCast_100m_m1_067]|nr:apolipoprotein N-acyltransferase [Cyanobacteria bacterium M_DeepCast_100m_m1_067]